ncbi:hypothetical protein P7D58_00500 [Enterococcus avium]|uniref:hypothetical protein n=1 Tax=Enterococcus avium TaxID=33945 RepID=UPI00289054F7|nr:hypothetical protein [Enterococcus avium]MDT2392145.1 hypothetical protein [Enterococcus avium]MDT2416747.1 hypothetical protein [Enterococcus avium]MDT2429479.1 hypothetical protein [Enterococcus avium]MDT2438464.1 hypothetical protein [Enterococcus avium]MDT2451353.1 hypothetical protein [Enterococcus avium]
MSYKDRAWHKKTGELGYVLREKAYLTNPLQYDFITDSGRRRYVTDDDIVIIDEGKETKGRLKRKWAKRKRK